MEKSDVLQYVAEYLNENGRKSNDDVVPVSGGVLSTSDIQNLVECALGGWVTEGKFAARFANKLKKHVGSKHVRLVNSGSSANLVAFVSLVDHWREKGADYRQFKVITPACGFPTTVSPIMQNNFIPLFIDSDPQTLNPITDDILEALGHSEVAGIVAAHTLGFPFDADIVRKRCDALGKFFLEDNCDALGSEINGIKTGMFGHTSTTSFFPAHHICAGEGGAVFTDMDELHRIGGEYTSWGKKCWCVPGQDNACGKRFGHEHERMPRGYDHKYTFGRFGYNLKMTDMQASLGESQMNRVDEIIAARQANFSRLKTWLVNHYDEYMFTVMYDESRITPSPFGFPITLRHRCSFTKVELVNFLERNGVRTRPVFAGNITRQPMFDNNHYEVWDCLDGADYIMNNTFWIGCHPELTEKHFERIMSVFNDFMKGYK